MHVLFVHQNFPAQFRYLAPRLVRDFGWKCTFVTERAEDSLAGIEKIVYQRRGGATLAQHICTRNFENAMGQAHGVYDALKQRPDVQPDLVVAHSGFGSSLFLPHLYDAPIINFFEMFYRPGRGDMGFRLERPVTEMALLRSRSRNAMMLLDLVNCTRGWTPTHYQRDFFPPEFRDKIEVIFDGIDTEMYYRRPNPHRQIGGDRSVPAGPRIVTYVARGFEMMRGFDIFMKAARRIYEQYPDVVFVVVGTDNVHYGNDLALIRDKSFRHHVLASGEYDLSRFIFTGYVSQETLANILSISDLHIYLTEPFIASWSMVDAMACGAVLLASDQTCVREYVTHGENGLLRDFFDVEGLAKQAVEVLKDPPIFKPLAEAAVRTVQEKYSLNVAMPRLRAFFEQVAAHKRKPSELASRLVRKGIYNISDDEDPDAEARAVVAGVGGRSVAPKQGAVVAPLPDVSHLPAFEGAMSLLRELSGRAADIEGWVCLTQSFRGPAGEFSRIGPKNHPEDLARALKRIGKWTPGLVLEIGSGDGGMTFLLARAATDRARIVCAIVPGVVLSDERVKFLKAMVRGSQQIDVLHGFENWSALQERIDSIRAGRKFDVLFMTGLRPSADVRANFRHFRNRVRGGGLFAFDGIRPVIAPDESRDGGDKLWREIKPMYPQNADYLSGTNGTSGGIGIVKV